VSIRVEWAGFRHEEALRHTIRGQSDSDTEDIPYPVETVHNAGVTKYQGRYVMLFRSHLDTGRSIIGLAESKDGFTLRRARSRS